MKKRHILVFVLTFVLLGGGLILFLNQKPIFSADTVAPPSSGYNWFNNGPGMGGRIPKITVDQASPNVIYVGHDVAGVSKSIDSGESWFPINNGLNNYDSGGVAVDFSDHNTIYTTTNRGLYKSINGGEQWMLKSADVRVNKWKGNSGAGTISVSQSKSNPDILYAISWEGEFYKDPDNFKFWIYKSSDHGETWTKMPGSDPNIIQPVADKSQGNVLRSIAVDPANENKVYIGGDKGMYGTSDGGASWSRVTGLDTRINYSLGYDDGSTDFNHLTNASIISNMCANDTDTAWNSDTSKACISQHGVNVTAGRSILTARDIRSITFNPYNPNQVFALSAWGHIFRSNDAGATWHEIYHRDTAFDTNFPEGGHINGFMQSNLSWNDVDWYSYDSTAYRGNFHRQSSGGIFETIKVDANPDAANVDTCKNNLDQCDYNIYVNLESGEGRSKRIWRLPSNKIQLGGYFGGPTPCMEYQQQFPTYCGEYVDVYGDKELWEPILSDDKIGGNLSRNDWTFSKSWQGFSGIDMFDLDLSSNYPNRTIYASGMWGAAKGVASEKYKVVGKSGADQLTGYSYNYDWNWSWKGLDDVGVTEALYDPLNPRFIYMTAFDHGFIRSVDGGKTFERSISGVRTSYPGWGTDGQDAYFGGWGHALAVGVNNGRTTVYIGLSKWGYAGGTLFKSTDHGDIWTNASGTPGALTALPPELPNGGNSRISSIVIDPSDPNRIFLTYDQSYYSHEACIKAYDACKNAADCRDIYSSVDLDTWKTQTCESSQNLSIWRTSLTQSDIDNGKTLDGTGRRPATVNLSNPIWTTGDNGATWQSVKADGLPTSSWGTVEYDSSSDSLYYGTFDFSCDPTDGNCHRYGIYKLSPFKNSANPGVVWTRLNTTVTHKEDLVIDQGKPSERTLVRSKTQGDVGGRVLDIKINPFDKNEILAITQSWMRGRPGIQDDTPDSFLVRSKDGGATWEELAIYPATSLAKISYDPFRKDRIAINLGNYDNGGNIGFMLSVDNGSTWTTDKNMPSLITNTTAFHPFNPLKMVIGSSGNGVSWTYNTLKPADTNGDSKVDIFDLARFAAAWGKNGYQGDLNDDGKVDIFDLSIFSAGWGK